MNDIEGPISSGVTTSLEFEEALRAAEDLMRQADSEQERAERVLAAEVGAAAVAIAVAVIIAIIGFSSGFASRVLVAIVGGLAGLIVAAGLERVRIRLMARSRRDEQAALDVVSLLREVVMLLPETEHWNETQLRLARARLSRFPIGTVRFYED